MNVCVLICSKNGSGSISRAVSSAITQCPVWVCDDGSDDDTANVAAKAGATRVVKNKKSIGKPQSVWKTIVSERLTVRFESIVIMDDDTILAPDFIEIANAELKPGVAIVVGKTLTDWPDEHRWNIWIGSRAYSYWRYQTFLRQGQSAFNVMNCISGSNSLYRSDVLDKVVVKDTPYIVDDTFWTLETHRKDLGKIRYAPQAEAFIQDPITFGDWYKQNLRWLWGSFQGIWGHKVGRQFTKFDLAYLALIFDWAWYVLALPVFFIITLTQNYVDKEVFLVVYFGGYVVWTTMAAIVLKKWRLFFMTPAIIMIDWVYRLIFVHAFFKSIRQPRVESCSWESPTRYEAV